MSRSACRREDESAVVGEAHRRTAPAWDRAGPIASPVFRFHRRAVLSPLPVSPLVPSALIATATISAAWRRTGQSCPPVRTSHSRAVMSWLPVRTSPVVRRESHRPHPVLVRQRLADEPAGRHFPDIRIVVLVARNHQASVGAEGGAEVFPHPVPNGPALAAADSGSGISSNKRRVEVGQRQGRVAFDQRDPSLTGQGQIPDAAPVGHPIR